MAEQEEKITMSVAEVREMLEGQRKSDEMIAALTEKVNGLLASAGSTTPTLARNTVKQRTAGIRFVNGKAVIGFKNRGVENKPLYVYQRPDPNDTSKRVLFVDLILDGEKDPLPVNYNEFLTEAETRQLEILRTIDEPVVVEQGVVRRKEWIGDELIETEVIVPVGAEGVYRQYVLSDKENQKELVIAEEYLNMGR